jgi:hypothetical protein
MHRLVSASTIQGISLQGSSFVEVRKVGCHGLAVFGKAVLFDTSALQSHGLVEDSKTVAPQIDKMICPGAL